MTVPAALRELEKIEMVRRTDGRYRLDHAVTKKQKTILSAFLDLMKTVSAAQQQRSAVFWYQASHCDGEKGTAMARTRSIASIESEIQKTEAELSALSKKYDETAERLKDLQKQKQDYENRQIIEAYRKSNKSLDEVMIFLGE